MPLAAIPRDDTRAPGAGERDPHLAGDARETTTLSPAVLATVAGEHLKVALRDVVGAPGAHTLVVPVAAGDAVELYAIDADAEGVTVRPRTLVDRTRSLADVEIDGEARLVGSVSSPAFAAAANAAAVLVAADALGAAARALELTTQYVGERKQFGVPVGSFQAVKHAAAEMLVDVEAARSAVMHAAWAVGAGEDEAARHASIAKAVACAGAVARGRQGALPARRGRLHVGARPAVPVQAHQERRAAVRLAGHAPRPARRRAAVKAIVLQRFGGPEALEVVRLARPGAVARLGGRRAARGGAELA